MSSPNNINSPWVSTSTPNGSLLSGILPPQQGLASSGFEPIQHLLLYVSDEQTAKLLSDKLTEIINPIFKETDVCVNWLIENGTVRFWKPVWFILFAGEWKVSAKVYNTQKSFDMLGFIEQHKDMIVAFEAEGISKFKG